MNKAVMAFLRTLSTLAVLASLGQSPCHASVMVLDSRGNVEMVDQEYDARYDSLRANAVSVRGVWALVTQDAPLNFDFVVKGPHHIARFRDVPGEQFLRVEAPTPSTHTTNGALIVWGGVGIAKDLFVGGKITNDDFLIETGGPIYVTSGQGVKTSSGAVVVQSADAGHSGVSGDLKFFSGTTSHGDSGSLRLSTGPANTGKGGQISMQVGVGDTGDGGDIELAAGETTETTNAQGGNVNIRAGLASAHSSQSTTVGGDVKISGGKSMSAKGTGGSIAIKSGESDKRSSGSVFIASANAGTSGGVSGALSFSTGSSTDGDSGSILMKTGDSVANGKAGNVEILVGSGVDGRGGDFVAEAGSTSTLSGKTGGLLKLYSGHSAKGSSGAILVNSADAGEAGVYE